MTHGDAVAKWRGRPNMVATGAVPPVCQFMLVALVCNIEPLQNPGPVKRGHDDLFSLPFAPDLVR
eukprot:9500707-Pyramimonas_sp.AAC.1